MQGCFSMRGEAEPRCSSCEDFLSVPWGLLRVLKGKQRLPATLRISSHLFLSFLLNLAPCTSLFLRLPNGEWRIGSEFVSYIPVKDSSHPHSPPPAKAQHWNYWPSTFRLGNPRSRGAVRTPHTGFCFCREPPVWREKDDLWLHCSANPWQTERCEWGVWKSQVGLPQCHFVLAVSTLDRAVAWCQLYLVQLCQHLHHLPGCCEIGANMNNRGSTQCTDRHLLLLRKGKRVYNLFFNTIKGGTPGNIIYKTSMVNRAAHLLQWQRYEAEKVSQKLFVCNSLNIA